MLWVRSQRINKLQNKDTMASFEHAKVEGELSNEQ